MNAAVRPARQIIGPQPGPQTMFSACTADIAVFGGSGGGGKTRSLVDEAAKWIGVPGFGAVMFRRTFPDIRRPGGLKDATMEVFPLFGGKLREDYMTWTFPAKSTVQLAHLQHEKDIYDWKGSEVALFLWDELTSFTRTQFFYMLSRNRSKCGVRPYIRASTNPDAESWVAELVAWWWDPQTGLAIPERSGVIRWFIQDPKGGGLIWADTREELLEQDKDSEPLSFTFIRSKLEDNQVLMDRDPAYRSRLKALDPVERARLLDGNWLTKPAPGLYFQREWCPTVYADELPPHIDWCRGWDRAATPKTPENDPDWTVGVRIGKDAYGNFYVEDAVRLRASSMHVEQAIINTARIDDASHEVPTRIQLAQDPAQAGKGEAEQMVRLLAGHDVHAQLEGGDKLTRFKAFSAQAENRNVKIVLQRDPAGNAWIKPWAACLEQFPPAKNTGHDDDVDATSTAFNALLTMPSVAMLMRMGGG